MSDKYGECYCGDCISFNKCKSDKGTRINLVSEGCSCFEPNDIAEVDYPILPKWLAEHDKQIRADAIEDAIHRLDNSKAICHEDYIDGIDLAIGVLVNIAEQMQKGAENEQLE